MGKLRSIWLFIRRHKYLVTIIFFAIMIGFVGENSIWSRHRLTQEIEALKMEREGYIEQFKRDSAELHNLLHNPEAAEKMARERYLMKRPDEEIYVFLDHDPNAKADTVAAPEEMVVPANTEAN